MADATTPPTPTPTVSTSSGFMTFQARTPGWRPIAHIVRIDSIAHASFTGELITVHTTATEKIEIMGKPAELQDLWTQICLRITHRSVQAPE